MPTPTEMLEQATAEINAGRVREGARLAYEAVFTAVSAAAARNQVPCHNDEDAEEFLFRLDDPPFDPDDWHKHYDPTGQEMLPMLEFTAGFDIALAYKQHAEAPLTDWQPEEYTLFLPVVAGLIEDLKEAQLPKEAAWIGNAI